MRYCNHCHRITSGEALFCNFCGRSYDSRLCPHRHPNPRNAEICSQCGSRELSTPHPRVPFLLLPLVWLLTALPGLLLVIVSILFAFGLLRTLLTNQALMFQAVLAGLMLAFLWYLYMHLPHFLRRLISNLFRRRHRDDHD
ncbi:MAG: zinc ribbon domain-containing protein [Bryobacteraceae bacterium]|jgi:RNA polymerase subunit RPABC4/transcription elongation factor Spt4